MFNLKIIEELNKRKKRIKINNMYFLLSQYALLGLCICILSMFSFETQTILSTISSYNINSNQNIVADTLLNQFFNFSSLTFLVFCFSFFIININQSLKINYKKKELNLNRFFLFMTMFLVSLFSLFFIISEYYLTEGTFLYMFFLSIYNFYSFFFSIPLAFLSFVFEHFGLNIYNPNFFIVVIFSKFLMIFAFLCSVIKKIISGIELSISYQIDQNKVDKKIDSINDSILKNDQNLTILLEAKDSTYPFLYQYVKKNEVKIRKILLDKNKQIKKELEKENIIENI